MGNNNGLPTGYRCIKELGRGAQGIVYLLMNDTLAREEVAKVIILPQEEEERQRKLQGLQREILAMSRLNHPYIATIFRAEENECYFIMEKIGGGTFDDFLKNDYKIKDAIEIFEKVLQGLSHAHEKNLLHRDLKPENIMITDHGLPKIVDFGLVMNLHNKSGFGGSPSYMSPEHLFLTTLNIQSDIWSMGVILYKILTKKLPFSKIANIDELYQAIINDKYLIAQDSDFPSSLTKWEKSFVPICQKALQRKIENRYQNCEEMMEAINRVLTSYFNLPKQNICPHPKNQTCHSSYESLNWEDWRDGYALRIRDKAGNWILCKAETYKTKKGLGKIGGHYFYNKFNKQSALGNYYLTLSIENKWEVVWVAKIKRNSQDLPRYKRMLRKVNRGHKIISKLPKQYFLCPSQIMTDEATSSIYHTSQYIPAMNLKQIIQERKKNGTMLFSWKETFSVVYVLAYILDILHSHKIIHRDLKPDFIMCEVDGGLRLAGFHMAKYEADQKKGATTDEIFENDFAVNTLAAKADYTNEGVCLGTAQYMPPEQTVSCVSVSSKADIWAWGMIAHKMLTGRTLFEGLHFLDNIKAIQAYNSYDSYMTTLPANIPSCFSDIIRRSLSKNPQIRPTASEILSCLKELA